jgi:energy-coupling factor transport system ATP-binding protein
MLALQGLSYRYAGATRPSLIDIDLAIGNGEVVGLVGPNEAGKSTVCLVASGLAPRAIRGSLTGKLTIDAEDVADWPMHELNSRVGIAFQNPRTQLSGVASTVYEEVCFGMMNLGVPRDELVARAGDALRLLRIGDLVERDPTRLSGGQMQLVALAGLLALRPAHLVLDEPTAQLDPEGTRLVADALRELVAAGTALLVAEHKTDMLEGLCDRIVVLDAGRIAIEGPTGAVLADGRLAELGVEPPSHIRLARALEARGLDPALANLGPGACAPGAGGPA